MTRYLKTGVTSLISMLALAITATAACGAELAQSGAGAKNLGYEFIKNAKFGIFVHFTAGGSDFAPGKPNPQPWDLDAHADAFDVKGFADAVEEMGAQYVTLTSFHAAMYLLGPSKVMSDIGMPKHQAKRDLIGELADELNKRGIALCLYVHPADQHDLSREERALFGWGPEVDGLPGPKLGLWPNPKWDDFILGLFKEMSLRYGTRVSGYWIDRHTPKRFANAKRMADALRAGNPGAVIWQSGPDYVQDGLSLQDAWPAAEGGDTTHGEKDQCCICATDNAWFQGNKVQVPADEVFRGVVRCAGCPDQEGGIHVALTPYATGYAPKVRELMTEFGKYWRERKVALFNTRPSKIFEIEQKANPWPIVATDTPDGSTVFVHVLIPPTGKSIHLPAPKDGHKLGAASLLIGGGQVQLKQSEAGVDLSLPVGANWDPVDTVIVLKVATPRVTLNLDGIWQIGEGGMDSPPATFERNVPVPGLVDMAQPPFVEPGPKLTHLDKFSQKDPRRDAFWYRRSFTLAAPLTTAATLKVGKAMFGMRVILNGKVLGEQAACFTSGLFDARAALKTGENELLIRVGADRNVVASNAPSGFDYEKQRYIPGIFDSVELIQSATPHIANLQVAPDLTQQKARVRVWLDQATAGDMTLEVREAKSGKLAGKTTVHLSADANQMLDVDVPISECRWWSPEYPFLYTLTARTAGDEFQTRFGMRTFKFDPATGRALLNGKPYIMRGSNFTLYRFFEDPQRGTLPWNEEWVRTLHRRAKDMHWNCLRYCIGFPPEFWYRIADEEGLLIQDEFPIWNMERGKAAEYDVDSLAGEYRSWMQERWNHPCVVIWDACNETRSSDIAKAFAKVRALDLSNRPWDNGWQPPQDPGDCFESHPYHFINPQFKLSDLAKSDPAQVGNVCRETGKHAVVINEYGWLWLNRDGTPTTLTKELYNNLLGEHSTTEQRRHLYARYFAAETEFWRCNRKAAAVMHFTSLGYSRPDGQTSDHWADIEKLTWEPEFYRYVRDAFAPVGLMIDAWAAEYPAGKRQEFPVVVINDLYENWQGDVRFRLLRDGKTIEVKIQPCSVPALGDAKFTFAIDIPAAEGSYQVEAALIKPGSEPVRSLRDFSTKTGDKRKE